MWRQKGEERGKAMSWMWWKGLVFPLADVDSYVHLRFVGILDGGVLFFATCSLHSPALLLHLCAMCYIDGWILPFSSFSRGYLVMYADTGPETGSVAG